MDIHSLIGLNHANMWKGVKYIGGNKWPNNSMCWGEYWAVIYSQSVVFLIVLTFQASCRSQTNSCIDYLEQSWIGLKKNEAFSRDLAAKLPPAVLYV